MRIENGTSETGISESAGVNAERSETRLDPLKNFNFPFSIPGLSRSFSPDAHVVGEV